MSDLLVYKVTAPSLISRTRHIVNATTKHIEYVKKGPVSSENRIVFYRPHGHRATEQSQACDGSLIVEFETADTEPRRYLKPCATPIPLNYVQPTNSGPCREPLTALPDLGSQPNSSHMSQPCLMSLDGLESSTLPYQTLSHLPLNTHRASRTFLDSVSKPTKLLPRRYTGTAMHSGMEGCSPRDSDDDGIDLLAYPSGEDKLERPADACFNHPGYGPEFYRSQHSRRSLHTLGWLLPRPRQPLHRLLTPHNREPVVPSPSRPLSSSVYPQRTRSVTASAKGLATELPALVDPLPGLVLWDVTTRRWRQQQYLNFINPRASVAHWVRVVQGPSHHKDSGLQYAFEWCDSLVETPLSSGPNTTMVDGSSTLDPPTSASHQYDQAAWTQPNSPRSLRSNAPLGDKRARSRGHPGVTCEYYWEASTFSSTLVCYERRTGLPVAKFKRKLWALTYSGKLIVVRALVPSQAFLEFLLFSCLVVLELREH
ncbi:hypothetical protein H4R34_005605 [Dimargaris verticillata]|uniref:Uncharacterized protein n=1 Tax=Dimargaris verticillata TaxID=2761393 RepID=A0A9W8B2L8_9FUNG|nr:hypothetical protein H4R34_005605 [Dimargaris verticillata]